QIAQGGPVTLTDPGMTRFIMTLEQSVSLLLKSMTLALGGEVFVTKMPVICLKDLTEVMIEVLSPIFGHAREQVIIKEIGPRPGEKMYEELMSEEEIRRSVELEDLFVVFPAFRNIYAAIDYTYQGFLEKPVTSVYNSANEKPMSQDEIREFLLLPGVLPEDIRRRLSE
ncbi:MAG: polysaccharide biosynthesis protein, partial [Pseudomonadota bacterium]